MTRYPIEIHIERLCLRSCRAVGSARMREEVEQRLAKLLEERPLPLHGGRRLEILRARAPSERPDGRAGGPAEAIHGAITEGTK